MRRTAVLLLALIVTTAWLWNPGRAPRFDNADDGFPSFRAEVYGGAPKGICYRVFVPSIARVAQDWTPAVIRRPLVALAGYVPFSLMRLEDGLMPAYAAVGAVSFAAYLALGLFAGPLALLLAWAAIGPHGGLGDPVTLAAFSCGVWALSAGKPRAFWLAFAVAALNRETAGLLLIWWCLAGRSLRAAGVGFVCWCVLRGLLALHFEGNEMKMCWPMLARNVKLIAPLSATTALAYLFGGFLLARGLAQVAPWQRRGFLVGLLLLAVMAALWSRPERARGYLELLPLAALAMGRGLRSFTTQGGDHA